MTTTSSAATDASAGQARPGKMLVSDRPAPAAPSGPLRGISDIRRFFYRNEAPIYFVSATPFNLLGMDEWIRRFVFINAIDCFDGAHPSVFVPKEREHEPFESIEDIVAYLLEHPEML